MKIAVIQIRGIIGIHPKLRDTLKFLNLTKKNSCAVISDSRNVLGMVVKVKDYVTWGEISEDVFRKLLEKRGRLAANKPLTEQYLKSKTGFGFDEFAKNFFEDKSKLKDVPGLKNFFRLTPPRGGFEREGIKKPYSMGGALGYRRKEINELIGRML